MSTGVYRRDGRAPIPANTTISRKMSAIRAKNTKPELLLRKNFSSAGIKGHARHLKNMPGRPDFAFRKQRLAIFVHGCFWHGCPYCKLKLPKTHRAFWKKKIETNKARDARKTRELRKLGWCVLTVWEHQIRNEAQRVVARVMKELDAA